MNADNLNNIDYCLGSLAFTAYINQPQDGDINFNNTYCFIMKYLSRILKLDKEYFFNGFKDAYLDCYEEEEEENDIQESFDSICSQCRLDFKDCTIRDASEEIAECIDMLYCRNVNGLKCLPDSLSEFAGPIGIIDRENQKIINSLIKEDS